MQTSKRGIMGFTLIELMVVNVIIGVLASVALPAYSSYREKAMIAQATSDLKVIQYAIEILAIDTERWPGPGEVGEVADAECWDLSGPAAGLLANDGSFTGWDGPYLDSVPKDPWGNPYIYISPGLHHKDYDLESYGKDGEDGGTGDDRDVENWNLDES